MAVRIVSDSEFKNSIEMCNMALRRFGKSIMVTRGKPIIMLGNQRLVTCDNRDEAMKVIQALTMFAQLA